MATIKLKRSDVPGKVPLPGDLELGELALNTTDGNLFLKKNDGTVEQVRDAVLRQDLANPEKGPWAIGGVVVKLPTLANLQSAEDSYVGLVVEVAGRETPHDGGGALWEVVDGVAPNGFTSVGLANGLVAEIVPERGEVSAEACGCIGSGNVTGAAQAWLNYSASKGVKAVTTTASRMTVSGLSLPGGCDVDFGNRELFLADGSNVPLLMNANRSFTAKLDKNISVRGRVPLNCNEAGQAALDADGVNVSGVRFVGVENIHFNIHVKSAARYQIWLINVDGFFSDHLVITATHESGYLNTDGLHINGKCSNINVGRLEIYGCEDDALAINADDVDHGGDYTVEMVSGPIDNVTIGSLHTDHGCWQTIRLLSAVSEISNVYIGPVSGSFVRHAVLAEPYQLGTGGKYTNVRIESIKMRMVDAGVGEALLHRRFVWLDLELNGTSDISIGDIYRHQISTNVDSQQIYTVYVSTGDSTFVNVGNVTEMNCGNTHGLGVKASGAYGSVTVGTWARLESSVSTAMVRVTGGGRLGLLDIKGEVSPGFANTIEADGGGEIDVIRVGVPTTYPSDVFLKLDAVQVGTLVTQGAPLISDRLWKVTNGASVTRSTQMCVPQIQGGEGGHSNPAQGLLQYDNIAARFVYWNGTQWLSWAPTPLV